MCGYCKSEDVFVCDGEYERGEEVYVWVESVREETRCLLVCGEGERCMWRV